MDESSESEARRVLRDDSDVVAEPWEERAEVIEAGLDDNTAPPPGSAGDGAGDRGGDAHGASAPNAPPPPGTSVGEGPATAG